MNWRLLGLAFAWGITGLWLWPSCATIQPIQGGPKDETPPRIVPELSTLNEQVNFRPARIELTFDEWVTLNDVFNQVVISPPLEYRPEITLKKRTVTVQFDPREQLRPNATYTINFGSAVRDLTEQNVPDDLRFIFATGPAIDSLSVEGIIVNAWTGEPVEKALFMLYDNLADSVVRTERPLYFGRAGKDGRFRIPNVRADTLKGFALLDADLNYRFNQSREPIGFPDGLVITTDNAARNLRIRLHEEARPTRLTDRDVAQFGRIRLAYNQKPAYWDIAASDPAQTWLTEWAGDTLKLWYDRSDTSAWRLYIRADSMPADTIVVKPAAPREVFLASEKLSLASPVPGSTALLHPDKPATLAFNRPVAAIDTSLISWREDTLRLPLLQPVVWQPDTAAPRTWSASAPWKETLLYEMEALPGAFTDRYGQHNTDTLRVRWRIEQRKNFATLHLLLEDLLPEEQYVVILLNSANTEVLRQTVQGATTQKFSLSALQPGQYSLRVIQDTNRNGRWDAGLYDAARQPEPVFLFPLEQLRANWELESKVSLKPKE